MKIETIKVVAQDGFKIINKSDFNQKTDVEYGKQPAPASKKKAKKVR